MIGEKLTGEVKNLLKHLIYSSRPFGFDQNILNGILVNSVDNNKRNQLTGALICRSDLYLQYLEGPIESINETFKKISTEEHVCIGKERADYTDSIYITVYFLIQTSR